MRKLIIVCFLAGALPGCQPIEGAGFTNSGKPGKPACLLSKKGSVERWGDCPQGKR